jgi:hypothetical protein
MRVEPQATIPEMATLTAMAIIDAAVVQSDEADDGSSLEKVNIPG